MAIDFTSVNSSPVRHLKTPFSGLGIAANQDFSILAYARFEENTNLFWYFLSSGPVSGANINLWRQGPGDGRLSALVNGVITATTSGGSQAINNGESFLASFSRRNGLASVRLCKIGSGKVDGWADVANTSAYTAAASDLFFGARQDLDTGREWHGQMSDVIICHDYGLTVDESIAAANGAVLDQLPFWQYRKFHTDMSFDPSTSTGLTDLVGGRALTAVNSGWGAKTDDPALLRRYSQFLIVPRLFSVPVSESTQNLTPSLFTNSNTFYAATVTTGAVTLQPALFSDSDTFYSATVNASIDLTAALFTDSDTFYAATVSQSGAPQTLTPSLFVDDDTFYAATVSAGTVILAPSLFTDADSFYAATVSATYDLAPALFTDSDTFHSPTISLGAATLSASLFTDSDTFYTHTVSLGGAGQDLTPALFNDSDIFYAPTVTTGAVTLQPSLFIDADTFYSATIANGSVILEPPVVDDADIFYAPDVSTSNALVVDLFTDSDTFYSPAVSVGAVTLTASLFIDSDSFYSHTVTGGESGNTPAIRTFSIQRENRVYSIQ